MKRAISRICALLVWEWLWAILLGLGVGILLGLVFASGLSISSESTSRFFGAFFGSLFGVLGAVSLYFLKEHRDRNRVQKSLTYLIQRSEKMFERVCETNLEPKVVAVRLVRYIQYIKNIKEYCGKQQYDHVDLGEIYWIIGGVLRDMDGKEKFARQVIDSNDQTKVDLLIEIAKSMNDTVGNLEKLRMFQSLSWTSK